MRFVERGQLLRASGRFLQLGRISSVLAGSGMLLLLVVAVAAQDRAESPVPTRNRSQSLQRQNLAQSGDESIQEKAAIPADSSAEQDAITIPSPALDILRHIVIQHNGRNKPFDSFARETLKLVTGKARWKEQDPVQTVFAIIAEPESWQAQRLIAVPFVPLREALGIPRTTSYVSYDALVSTRKLMRMLPAIVQKQQRDEKLSILEQETMDLFQRFVALSNLLEQRLPLIPPSGSSDRVWLPILQPQGYPPQQQATLRDAWTALISALRDSRHESVAASAAQLSTLLQRANPPGYPTRWRLVLEVLYHRLQIFHLACAIYALAFVAFVFGLGTGQLWIRTAATATLRTGFVFHVVGIALRVILGGRPPVSNFFETTLWLPFVAVTIAIIFEAIYHVGYFGLSASLLAAITLLLADYLPLDSSISPVVAVLRSNLWLTVHVLTVVASYGALSLAMVLAHVYAWQYLFRRQTKASPSSMALFLYRAIQVGVVLLAGGIMLGAVWANASWGRYWGWDPKETWALITLLWFLAILHGRFAGWLRGLGMAVCTILGFFLLLMTYYGVSFYLVGLHSYAGGHAKPLPPLLIGYVIAELIFLCAIAATTFARKKLPAA